MSDLSNLLGDVYGDHESADAAPVRREPPATDRTTDESPKGAWTSAAPVAPPVSVSVTAPVAAATGSPWNTGDDDIFPSGRGAKKKK